VTRERTREIQRLEKLLEDAGIKLSSVAADLNGASYGGRWLEALCWPAKTDPAAMAQAGPRNGYGARSRQLTEDPLRSGSPPITRF